MSLKPLTAKQQKVFEAAKVLLQQEPWYRGVCTDELSVMSDEEIQQDFEGAVSTVFMDTATWDAPLIMQVLSEGPTAWKDGKTA